MFEWSWNNFIQYLTIIYKVSGKLCLNAVNSSICVYICSILACVIHVSGKGATCMHHLYWVFIDFLCMYVDFYSFSFRHLNAGPMALPTDDKHQCHPYDCLYVKVDKEIIPKYQMISLV